MCVTRKKRSLLAAVLALAVIAAGLFPRIPALAEHKINTEKLCSLEIRIGDPEEESFEELKELPVAVDLYRVADMAEDASVTAVEAFADEALDMGQFPGGDVQKLTDDLLKFVNEHLVYPDEELTVTQVHKVEDLKTGLYLLVPKPVRLDEYEYQFSPSLISLPTTDLELSVPEEELFPITYDASLVLKKEKVDLFGSLVIEKTLRTYHENQGVAKFAYDVVAVKDGKVVWNDLLTLSFNAPGVKEVLIGRLPVGAEVTVTEVDCGAGYSLVSDRVVGPLRIQAASEEGSQAVRASFVNDYKGTGITGNGVINHFEYNGDDEAPAWSWSQETSN